MTDRRDTLRWMLTASALMPLSSLARGTSAAGASTPPPAPATAVHGYGTDPDLTKSYRAGDLWPLTLSAQQRKTATALCDVMIPEDFVSRSASQVGVVDFLDEWVSAPYPAQQQDRQLILDGLSWIDAEATRRYAKGFADLSLLEHQAICDEICIERAAQPELARAAKFFARYRDLTSGGFYTSPEGRRDLRYVGNVPLARFDEPPADLLNQLGLI